MKQTPYVYFLWVTVTLLQAGIAIAMYRRKQHREFPVFWWYTVFHVVQSIIAFVASSVSYAVFFYVYWGTEAIDAIFTLVVLQEIFSKVFNPYSSLRNIGSVLFRWLAILLCLFAVFSAAVAPGVAADRFIRGLLTMERSIQLIQTGVLLFLFLFSKLFGLTWRHHIFGMALGFGVYASISLVASSLEAQFGKPVFAICSTLLASSYAMGAYIWSCYFLYKNNPDQVSQIPSSGQLHQWNEALAGLLKQVSRNKQVSPSGHHIHCASQNGPSQLRN